jgi:hypothetical protein
MHDSKAAQGTRTTIERAYVLHVNHGGQQRKRLLGK